jgi:hypothetical protein
MKSITSLNAPPAQHTARRSVLVVGLLAVIAAAGSTHAADRTVSVTERVDLTASPAKTWDAIKDFSNWQAWHPAFASTAVLEGDGRSKGTVRVLTTQDGAKFKEELVAFDAASRRYQYRIIDSPAPVVGYVSTIEVKATSTGSSVVWSSTFQVKEGTPDAEAKKLISGVYRAGLDHLATMMK